MTGALMIGGPLHGKRLAVRPNVKTVEVPVFDKHSHGKFRAVTYAERAIAGVGGVWAPVDLATESVVEFLIDFAGRS